ncbi:MAG: imidazole glycerol phosphate synthase subunit HisH [Gemmatimonadota bacterium]|nr:imidazole glycerol phosphate synthase subunit HisH [Gemmatimonadota bacterium]
MKIALYDYGAGNMHSLGKALEAAGAEVAMTDDWDEALDRDALVLPGVGAFGHAAASLPADRRPIREALDEGLPCLGICLGMQLLFDASDESEGDGIGRVPGRVEVIDAPIVPQMGWNDVETAADPIFEGVGPLVAYYANSYICVPANPRHAIAWSEYGGKRYASGVRVGNTWGLQFHPEKSSHAGRRIIWNFVAQVEQRAAGAGAHR